MGETAQPELPLVVGIDGGYVHSCEQKPNGASSFEVIVSKSVTLDGNAKSFGFVYSYDTKPQSRLFEVLKSQGMQMNQLLTFLSDDEDTVRELQFYLNPQAEYLLDWFHITMRLTVMNQMVKGLNKKDTEIDADIFKELERIKWYLWHGDVFRALQILSYLVLDLEVMLEENQLAVMEKATPRRIEILIPGQFSAIWGITISSTQCVTPNSHLPDFKDFGTVNV